MAVKGQTDDRVNVNSVLSIGSTIFMSITGWVVFMGMPILVGTLADLRGYGEAEIGYLASAELGGMFAASIVTSILLNRVNRRRVAMVGLLLSMVINVLAVSVESYFPFMALRIIAGFGSGLCYSIAVANLAGTRDKARNFSFLIFTLVGVNAIELYFLPSLTDAFGIGGIFYSFAMLNLVALLFVRNLASHLALEDAGHDTDNSASPSPFFAMLCIVAVALFYVCISAFWTYVERVGVEAGFASDFISRSLAFSTVLSLVGCYAAFKISQYVGQSLPLVITLFVITVTIFAMSEIPTQWMYFSGLVIYQLVWNSIDIYQLGTLSNIDRSGRYVALVSGAQGMGQMVGPTGAAVMITMGYGFSGALVFSASASFAAMLIYLVVHLRLRGDPQFDPRVMKDAGAFS